MSVDGKPDWLPTTVLEHVDGYVSKAACDAGRGARTEEFDDRARATRAAVGAAGTKGIAGACPLCAVPRHFDLRTADGQEPNLREALVCDGCGTNARARAGLFLLQSLCPDRAAAVYITEQVSSTWVWLQARYPAAVASEFERSESRRRELSRYLEMMGGNGEVRYEDVTDLTFASGSRQAVVSFDVLEHVPDYRAALREFARVTAQGGWLVLTAPFIGTERSLERARLHPDGRIEHLHPPEYHGDPLSDGVLCFHHFGWDVLDELRAAGFRNAAVVYPWWPEAGLFDGLATVVAQR